MKKQQTTPQMQVKTNLKAGMNPCYKCGAGEIENPHKGFPYQDEGQTGNSWGPSWGPSWGHSNPIKK